MAGLVKVPATKLLTCTLILKSVLASMFDPDVGNVIRDEIILVEAGMSPMTMPLHEPAMFCLPLVVVLPVQKLMKFVGSLFPISLISRKYRELLVRCRVGLPGFSVSSAS